MNKQLREKLAKLVMSGQLTLREAMGLEIACQVSKLVDRKTVIPHKFGTYGAELLNDILE